ncbi:tyrosine-protein phosphatase [Paenibacillus sp. MMS18-CY102]|uniref:tyrosine-protein phosphatase n=1 Tax=Paenibacillus sp. MMS18-CY102 TaxID=2682849 RepID=UPI0013651B92|nr:CpsB/CapC family capsule biosynthesis tyrosine phosphatase [Paenibacillus sp. MMS18-CY102]MWC27249.1 protein tyrosine phosphatase [Paenibacillus sp. MMS18-CY102]
MIDIHTHILPGIDDGAGDWEESLALARAAVAGGITAVVATPHHADERYYNKASDVVALTAQLNERLRAAGIPLLVRHGQEVRYHKELLDHLEQGELVTLAGSRYLLLELPSGSVPEGVPELIYELSLKGITPVIAHPERNRELANDTGKLLRLIELGALAQVTAHSLIGSFGKAIERVAWTMCRQGLIHLVSSDAHHCDRRSFRLEEAYGKVADKLGGHIAASYKRNAQLLVDDELIPSLAVPVTDATGAWGKMKRLFGRGSSE